MPIHYLDQHIGTRRVDFLIQNKISVELKAMIKLEDVHIAQAINYLEAYNLEIGLLINFGSKRLEFHRFTNKKFKAGIIHHPTNPNHPINPSSDK
jgi:GxxExxY protein